MGRPVKILLAGEGGQGVQAVAEIIAEAAYEKGREALYIPNFGIEQRGGVSLAFVQVGDEPIGPPRFETADLAIALSDRAVVRSRPYVGPETTFIYDSSIQTNHLPQGVARLVAVPAIEVSKKELHPRVFNVMILGAVIGLTGVITVEEAKEAIERRLGHRFEKDPALRELNHRAVERGVELVKGKL